MPPLLILGIGIATVIGMIVILRINAFIALISAALIVSMLAPAVPLNEKVSSVAAEFGKTAGKIGIVIALAVVIGKCMMDSGAADRIVRAFLSLLGEKRSATALMASGYVLSVPVFFDTALAIAAGGVITHSLVPPTPGPLFMAANLGIDIGVMIIAGALVALPASFVGMLLAGWFDRRMNIPLRPIGTGQAEPEPFDDSELPALSISLLPILLPVALISANTIVDVFAKTAAEGSFLRQFADVVAVLGNVNLAMLLAAAIAMWMLKSKRQLTLAQLSKVVEVSLMSGGIVILITAAGGAFGAMLEAADVGSAIAKLVPGDSGGVVLLILGAVIASIMKIAQGSGTVAMITASSMVAAMVPSMKSLGYHPAYLATAIGGGSMICSWMNDSGFWIFVKMTGLSEAEGLKSWTLLLALMGVATVVISLILAVVLPLA
ncbi:MAG: GntP family permease [Planctomycetota bacterium]|jgi:GntP family gluconate:H+ symporter